MDNKLRVWEVNAGDTHEFVLADGMQTMKQYFYIGSGGYIRERPDMEATTEMEIYRPKSLPPQKAEDFTKLELASLMIAQGFSSQEFHNTHQDTDIAQWSVSLAKAVLEEANK